MGQVRDDGPEDRVPAIQVELWLDGSMPTGVATVAGGPAREFTGWVGLMSAVDALAADRETRIVEEDSE
jgi:hypothetical protein